MNRTFAIAAIAVGASWATTAWADPPQLKGSYAFTGTAACLVAPGGVNGTTPVPNPTPGVPLGNSGFNTQLQPNDNATSFSHSFSVEGVRTFDGQGNGTASGTSVNITVRPTPGPTGFPTFPASASVSNFSFQFTYVVNPDNTFTTAMVPGSFIETITSGPRTGQTVTMPVTAQIPVNGIPPISGVISNNGQTLIAAHLATQVETRVYSNGDVDPEICHRSRVLIRLPNSGN